MVACSWFAVAYNGVFALVNLAHVVLAVCHLPRGRFAPQIEEVSVKSRRFVFFDKILLLLQRLVESVF